MLIILAIFNFIFIFYYVLFVNDYRFNQFFIINCEFWFVIIVFTFANEILFRHYIFNWTLFKTKDYYLSSNISSLLYGLTATIVFSSTLSDKNNPVAIIMIIYFVLFSSLGRFFQLIYYRVFHSNVLYQLFLSVIALLLTYITITIIL